MMAYFHSCLSPLFLQHKKQGRKKLNENNVVGLVELVPPTGALAGQQARPAQGLGALRKTSILKVEEAGKK
ncbi:MAG: hypothetical protein KDA48_15310 [Amphiplicatus sp.]|nr:hypothetical protein [Amphiplicatus sp.]